MIIAISVISAMCLNACAAASTGSVDAADDKQLSQPETGSAGDRVYLDEETGQAIADYNDAAMGHLDALFELIGVAMNAAPSGDGKTAIDAYVEAEDIYGKVASLQVPSQMRERHEIVTALAAKMHDTVAYFAEAARAREDGDNSKYDDNMALAEDMMNQATEGYKELNDDIQQFTDKLA